MYLFVNELIPISYTNDIVLVNNVDEGSLSKILEKFFHYRALSIVGRATFVRNTSHIHPKH